MSLKPGLIRFLITFFAILFVEGSQAGEVCRLRCIEGYADFCVRAKQYQQNVTRRIDRVVLYVERAKDGTFSFGSNVQSEGAAYPTKIVGFQDLTDLDTVLNNLDPSFQAQIDEKGEAALKVFHDTAEVHIAQSALTGSPSLDLSGVKKIHYVDGAR